MSHIMIGNRVSLGQRFIDCSCGEGFSGGAYDKIAERNYAHHVKTQNQVQQITVDTVDVSVGGRVVRVPGRMDVAPAQRGVTGYPFDDYDGTDESFEKLQDQGDYRDMPAGPERTAAKNEAFKQAYGG